MHNPIFTMILYSLLFIMIFQILYWKAFMTMHLRYLILTIFFLLTFCFPIYGESQELFLRENLKKAKAGDYIVTYQNKAYTVMHIHDKQDDTLTIEEITVPDRRISLETISWRNWIQQGAPGSTSWIIYQINLKNGDMSNYYSFSKNSWYDIPEADNFLSTLLNLKLNKISDKERKRVGPRTPKTATMDKRPLWQPSMVVNGQTIQGVAFDAYRTYWPKDGSELSGKTIEVFVPKENEMYPSYFPYWLQISGIIGKAKVRIVDSGTNLTSPRTYPECDIQGAISSPAACL